MNAVAAHSRPRRRFMLPGTSQTTTIIVVVVCAIGVLTLLYVFFRLTRRCWGRKSVPLPPVQPIAYQRQQLAQLAERNAMSLTPTYPSRFSTPEDFSPCGSDFSLPPNREYIGSPSSSCRLSPLLDTLPSGNVILTDFPTLSPSNGQAGERLLPRASMYDARRNSGSSVGSGSLRPPSTIHSSTSPYGPSRVARRSHLQSITSHHTTNTRHTIIGLPHSRHSPVQIVLPTPLAPAVAPYLSGSRSSENIRDLSAAESRGRTRLSVADPWTHTLHQFGSDGHLYSTRAAVRRPATASLSRLKVPSSTHHITPGPRDPPVFPSSPLVPAEHNARGPP